MSASIIAIGNPGAGKSTILNSLAGELLFKSGISIGAGLTYQLDEAKNEKGIFYDTPGLADDTYREAAGKAISTALRTGGPFKILFFVRTEAGRLVREDITTFKLVLECAPEIGNKYGIVTNKLPINVAKLLQDPKNTEQLLTKLFVNVPEENRCAPTSITYLTQRADADSVDNYLLELDSLMTLEGSYFSDFVYKQIPTVQLTVNAAKDIETGEFDKMTKLIETLERKMEADKEMFRKEQDQLRQQLEKAEEEKKEQTKRDWIMFNNQIEQMKIIMESKNREIEDAKDNARRVEKLQQERMEMVLENERLKYQADAAGIRENDSGNLCSFM